VNTVVARQSREEKRIASSHFQRNINAKNIFKKMQMIYFFSYCIEAFHLLNSPFLEKKKKN